MCDFASLDFQSFSPYFRHFSARIHTGVFPIFLINFLAHILLIPLYSQGLWHLKQKMDKRITNRTADLLASVRQKEQGFMKNAKSVIARIRSNTKIKRGAKRIAKGVHKLESSVVNLEHSVEHAASDMQHSIQEGLKVRLM